MFRRVALVLCLALPVTAQQTNEEKLVAHSGEFRPEIIKVTEGVWVAVGYALANAILVEGTDGVIIIDTTESKSMSREISPRSAADCSIFFSRTTTSLSKSPMIVRG